MRAKARAMKTDATPLRIFEKSEMAKMGLHAHVHVQHVHVHVTCTPRAHEGTVSSI